MKIVYVITKSDNGGAQNHLIQLANHFIENNEVYVIVGNKGSMLQKLDKRIKKIIINHLVGPISPKNDIIALKDLINLFNEIDPDIIHLHSSKAGTIGRIANKLAKKKQRKIFFTAHSWAFTDGVKWHKRLLYKSVEKMMLKYTDKAICVSEFDNNLAKRYHFNAKKLVTVYNGIPNDTKTLNIQLRNEERFEFVMTARFAYPKMQKEVINAVKHLKTLTDIPFKVTFIGDGATLKECKEITSKYNLNEYVSFLGNIEDAKELLKNYDVFILMSQHEGLPLSIIEAMVNKLPIIASNVGGISELIDGNGYLLTKNSSTELADVMKLYLNRNLIDTESEKSFRKYKQSFTEEKMLKELEKIYGTYSYNR